MGEGTLKTELITSEDGSHTLKVPALKEHYHSHRGAIQESLHVFLKMGLEPIDQGNELNILEVGFGTGLNVLLTALAQSKGSIHFDTLEPYPLEEKLIEQLNYPELIDDPKANEMFRKIHHVPWNQIEEIQASFSLMKHGCSLLDYIPSRKYDLIYYDAFAPHAQPELWVPEVWSKLFEWMNPKGRIVTYCAKGQVRRDLINAGFAVERLDGPPGKREMLRATKNG